MQPPNQATKPLSVSLYDARSLRLAVFAIALERRLGRLKSCMTNILQANVKGQCGQFGRTRPMLLELAKILSKVYFLFG